LEESHGSRLSKAGGSKRAGHYLSTTSSMFIPLSKKSNKEGKKPARMSKELLTELRRKGKVYGTQKEGQAAWEE